LGLEPGWAGCALASLATEPALSSHLFVFWCITFVALNNLLLAKTL
jgi:hypothetical protein